MNDDALETVFEGLAVKKNKPKRKKKSAPLENSKLKLSDEDLISLVEENGLEFIGSKNLDINSAVSGQGSFVSLLFYACANNEELIKKLATIDGIDLEKRDSEQLTPFLKSCKDGNLGAAQCLIDLKVDLSA